MSHHVVHRSNLRRTWKSLENLNKFAMEVQEHSNRKGRGTASQPRRRSSSESSDDSVRDERSLEREDLEYILESVEKLNSTCARLDRYGHGVPCIRPVRDLCSKLRLQLNNEHGSFNRTLEELARASVPGNRAIVECVDEIRNAVNRVAYDESEYIPRLEDIKQYLGELSGIINTVLQLVYQDCK
ncbi:uncharacterized protein LOC116612025 [Nematostella vectensis]|uniref:uncharacterized protein LOC116612025 n=1 Tax=Nematostella vectensis TaxID=45351 RepID=UPI00139024A7|nr:uncharacterized protein LOC116612025 [Nematostella vectensis]